MVAATFVTSPASSSMRIVTFVMLGLVVFPVMFVSTRPMASMALCWLLVAGSQRLVVHAIHLLRFIFVHGDRSPTYSGG